MNKVIPRIFGGLGNQLFCYAAARRMAVINGAELVIDDTTGFQRDYIYKRIYQLNHFNIPCRKATPTERLEPFSRIQRRIKIFLNEPKNFLMRTYIKHNGMDFDPRILEIKPNGALYLEGHWQSEMYFKDIENIIRSDLVIRPPEDFINIRMSSLIRKSFSSVSVHVRFFDDPSDSSNSNAPKAYYSNAILRMESLAPNSHYFIFSDNPNAARKLIDLPDHRITLVMHNQGEENSYADLWLMSQCKHFIIANSTFSWWGAWLGGYKEKNIIAPKFILKGLTSWGFDGLIPSDWIQISCGVL